MSEPDLLQADAKRRNAMIAADVDALAQILSDDLTWTHSSGRTDDKQAVLDTIAGKSVRYLTLDIEDTVIASHGDIFIYTGIVQGRVIKDDAERELANKFLSVWKRSGTTYEMLAWQSTGL
ncbi:MAG: nuclear transport factor 2 family protein [Pseudomonadales bacterium]|jgi:ketosteroid isomerase-like protein|nr:nuclear transport factor 2 family protein [Pseudomonadales bacterium]MDP6472513.1 nuclear transport factor 2 family protein [Pseudomonadales bacterium]MDP6828676.1 nuclear transport factor 2 family protein [Pseudomonadales bacterium]MDP6973094.1 nuclear transport factor 2 family protein [Pseudomonadales bacterium]|tara:strand:- start:1217 stop:1579 length:363 start_codon:yes stop_codon:yes gene_type:complete